MRIALGVLIAGLLAAGATAWGQVEILDARTTASLRGVDAVSTRVAWASGTKGTVLLTVDGGVSWQHCAVPKGAEELDFRGVQGFDEKTAVVMASGTGELSKIYKTTDGCLTWVMTFANPDADGFFDALRKTGAREMYLMGDPVRDKFAMFTSDDQGSTWFAADDPGRGSVKSGGGFAASNSAMTSVGPFLMFGTSATAGEAARVYVTRAKCAKLGVACTVEWRSTAVPMAGSVTTAGVFSLAGRMERGREGVAKVTAVAVGGDYSRPKDRAGSAATTTDGGESWVPARTMPGGYRSGVVWEAGAKRWVAVGPTGMDVSANDGRDWTPLNPGPGDAADAGKGWNAISMPFVVGAKGKVGRLRAEVIKR